MNHHRDDSSIRCYTVYVSHTPRKNMEFWWSKTTATHVQERAALMEFNNMQSNSILQQTIHKGYAWCHGQEDTLCCQASHIPVHQAAESQAKTHGTQPQWHFLRWLAMRGGYADTGQGCRRYSYRAAGSSSPWWRETSSRSPGIQAHPPGAPSPRAWRSPWRSGTTLCTVREGFSLPRAMHWRASEWVVAGTWSSHVWLYELPDGSWAPRPQNWRLTPWGMRLATAVLSAGRNPHQRSRSQIARLCAERCHPCQRRRWRESTCDDEWRQDPEINPSDTYKTLHTVVYATNTD